MGRMGGSGEADVLVIGAGPAGLHFLAGENRLDACPLLGGQLGIQLPPMGDMTAAAAAAPVKPAVESAPVAPPLP